MIQAMDWSGLLLLYTSAGNIKGLEKLAATSKELKKTNISFTANFVLGQLDNCLSLLVGSSAFCSCFRFPGYTG